MRIMLHVHERGVGVAGVYAMRDRGDEGEEGHVDGARGGVPAARHRRTGVGTPEQERMVTVTKELQINAAGVGRRGEAAAARVRDAGAPAPRDDEGQGGDRDPARLRGGPGPAREGARGLPRPHPGVAPQPQPGPGADGRLPARAAARRLARAGLGAQRAQRRRRAGGHHPRARLARRLPAGAAGGAPARHPLVHLARHRQGWRRRGGRHGRRGGVGERQRGRRGGGAPGGAATRSAPSRVNLVERAAKGLIDPLIGRRPEIERTIQVLCRRRKNNPVFVGEPGVGKTAIVEGLALAIHEKRVPAVLADGRRSSRSTWARCWRAPSSGASSSSG